MKAPFMLISMVQIPALYLCPKNLAYILWIEGDTDQQQLLDGSFLFHNYIQNLAMARFPTGMLTVRITYHVILSPQRPLPAIGILVCPVCRIPCDDVMLAVLPQGLCGGGVSPGHPLPTFLLPESRVHSKILAGKWQLPTVTLGL